MSACAYQETDIAEEYPCIQWNGQSLELVEKFCYADDTIVARSGALDVVLARKKEWAK